MSNESEHGGPKPLPRDWLPPPQPREGDPEWNRRFARVMSAAEPELRKIGNRQPAASSVGWFWIARWWKPAAGLAVASIALLIITDGWVIEPQPPASSIALRLVAADGDPVALWSEIGVRADPVLARIALQEVVISSDQNTQKETR
jgi:hypothetical protein